MNIKDRKGWESLRVTLMVMVVLFALQIMELRIGYAVEYPTRPITLICPFPAGGGADITARVVAEYLRKKWGQPISVVNVVGGGGVPGVKQALESKPDGYTFFTDVPATAAIMPALYESLPFDWTKRTPIARVHSTPTVYLVNSQSPYKTLGELAKAVKEQPQKFSWGSSGQTGGGTFQIGQFFDTIGVKISDTKMVVFSGTAPAATALAGGHVDIAGGSIDDTYALISAGKIRALAVGGNKRLPELPEVPTVIEAGFPQLDVELWQGISGPAGLPQYVVDKWATALREAVHDKEFITLSKNVKKDIAYLGPEDFKAYCLKEYKKYYDLARKMELVIRQK